MSFIEALVQTDARRGHPSRDNGLAADAVIGAGRALRELSLSLVGATEASDAFGAACAFFERFFQARCSLGWVFDQDERLELVSTCGGGGRIDAIQKVAISAAIQRRAVCIGPQKERPGARRAKAGYVVAAPIGSTARLRGVIAFEALPGSPTPTTEHIALAAAVGAELALALELHEARRELADTKERGELNQRQMEAFARDVRSTFAAEKQRAEQLASALDELERTYLATVKGLAVAVEAKDEYTAGHLQRVTRYGLAMMRMIAPDEAEDVQYEFAFLLHDVGKIAVPDAVLQKDGALTAEEWIVMRGHAQMGVRILQDIPFLTHAREIVGAHHERWDGKGYPRGLKGEEIPLGARVFSIADSFDAMCSDRPYRKALPVGQALEEIAKGAGTQFWAPAVDTFLQIPVADLEEVASGRYVSLEGLR